MRLAPRLAKLQTRLGQKVIGLQLLPLRRIVQLGLGGYVIGRSAEKIVPAVASALKK